MWTNNVSTCICWKKPMQHDKRTKEGTSLNIYVKNLKSGSKWDHNWNCTLLLSPEKHLTFKTYKEIRYIHLINSCIVLIINCLTFVTWLHRRQASRQNGVSETPKCLFWLFICFFMWEEMYDSRSLHIKCSRSKCIWTISITIRFLEFP